MISSKILNNKYPTSVYFSYFYVKYLFEKKNFKEIIKISEEILNKNSSYNDFLIIQKQLIYIMATISIIHTDSSENVIKEYLNKIFYEGIFKEICDSIEKTKKLYNINKNQIEYEKNQISKYERQIKSGKNISFAKKMIQFSEETIKKRLIFQRTYENLLIIYNKNYFYNFLKEKFLLPENAKKNDLKQMINLPEIYKKLIDNY